jgi:branched-chain amino acid transport system permease protein
MTAPNSGAEPALVSASGPAGLNLPGWGALRRQAAMPAAGAVLGIAALLAAPWVLTQYHIHILTLICIYVPLALGQNLITGNSGQLSMGHAAFYGFGAYTVGILAGQYDWPTMAILLVAVAGAGLVGLLVGLPTIRISGDYLFIVTIGMNLVFLDLVTQWVSLTGGTAGLPGLPPPRFGGLEILSYTDFYYFALLVAAVCVAVVLTVVRSRFGRTIEAVRDDPVAAAACGVGLVSVRLSVFVLGAALAGLAGAVLAYFLGFVGPTDFNILQSLLIFEMAILGGLGSVAGSVLGAALLIGIPEMLRFIQPYRLGMIGIIMILLMVYRPQGLLGRVNVINLIRK